jgi:hypothetical protein
MTPEFREPEQPRVTAVSRGSAHTFSKGPQDRIQPSPPPHVPLVKV